MEKYFFDLKLMIQFTRILGEVRFIICLGGKNTAKELMAQFLPKTDF